MMEWLILCSDTASAAVRVLVCFLIMHRAAAGKKQERTAAWIFAAVIVGTAVLSVLTALPGLPGVYRLALETAWIVFCGVRFGCLDVRMGLFIGIFYEIGVSFWQFLLGAGLGIWFGSPAFLDVGTGTGQAAAWILNGLLIVLCLCSRRYGDPKEKEGLRMAGGIVLAGFLAIITLSEQTVLEIPDATLDMWTFLSVILLTAVLVFHMNRQNQIEKELSRLKSEQAELLEREYHTLNQAYAVNAKLFHDFHNHIGVLRQLLTYGKTEEALGYLDELKAPVTELADTVWTGDETVDYLINSKAAEAEDKGIAYRVQVEFPRHMNIAGADLCAILGNLLDNALEAAARVPEEKERFVNLTIRRIQHMLVIKIENSFAGSVVLKDKELKTTKTEEGLHGWGLKSARAAAEKYDGTLKTSYADGVFRTVATLSYDRAGE